MSEEFGGRLLGMSLNYLAGAQSDLAGPAAAADTYSRNITFCEQRGFVFGEMVQRASILGVLFDLGRWPEVPREAEKVIEWAETNGYRSLMGSAKLSLVQVLILTGHLTQASSLDTEVLESAREANDEALIASAVVLAAAAAVAEGSYGQAREFVSEYDHMTRGNPNRNRELPELMRACHRVGERALATRLLEGADSPVPRHQHAAAGARAVFVEMTGDLAEAVRLHHGAAEGWAGFGHVYEEGQSLLGEGRCLVTLERRDEAADPIGRARQIFTDLGTAPLVAEVDALIGTQAASNS